MIELAMTLLDRLLAMVKQRQESDRKLHDDFLVPIVGDFEKLRQSYLDTFSAYRADLEKAADPLTADHPVLGRIARDAVFTAQLRAKLEALAEFRSDPVFADLVNAARSYVASGEMARFVLVEGQKAIPNVARQRLIEGWKRIFAGDAADAEKRDNALRVLDDIVAELQGGYQRFAASALHAKRRLLDKRIRG
jgi:hypothetical protein